MERFEMILWTTLAALVGLPIGGIWCLRHHQTAAVWSLFGIWAAIIIAIIARLAWVRQRQNRDKNRVIAKRQREGIRQRRPDDHEAPREEWRECWTKSDSQRWFNWVEGESRILKSDDILLKWGCWDPEEEKKPGYASRGYAIERSGKIVAEITTWKKYDG